MKLVSAILTTCKRAPAIVGRALSSILAQTYPNIETIVVDDSPADYPLRKEVELVVLRSAEQTGKSVRYIPLERNSGACIARNTGVHAANGEYVAFLDDDDEWLPEKIARLLPLMENGAVLAYCGSETVNDSTGERETRPFEEHRGRVYGELVTRNFVGSTSFPLIRRDALESIGGFDPEMVSVQDADVWVRLAVTGDFECTGECLNLYHTDHGERITSDPAKRIAGLERFNAKNAEYISAHPEAAWIRGMKLVPYYRQNGDVKKALSVWGKCARIKPLKIKSNLKYLALALIKR